MLIPSLALAAAAAAAVPAAIEPDLRCVAVLGAVVDKVPEAQRGYDLRAGLSALVADKTRAAGLAADLPRCTATVQDRGRMMQDVGRALAAEGATPR